MASSRRAPRRTSSHLLALAVVAAGISVAPKAQADPYYWPGGDNDSWDNAPWDGKNGTYAEVEWTRWPRLLFGSYTTGPGNIDNNGIVINDVQDDLKLDSLFFSNQNWVSRGQSLLFNVVFTENIIAAASPGINVEVNNDILLRGVINPTLVLRSDAADSILNITGQIRGEGYVRKTGPGIVELNRFHNYTDGTGIMEGTLVDHYPHGDYQFFAGSTLEFNIASDSSQTSIGDLRSLGGITGQGSGTLVKSGGGTLIFSGGTKDYDGATIVNDGFLYVDAPSASKSYTVNGGGRLVFQIAGNRTYANPVRVLGETGAFYKTGAGTLTLSNSTNALRYAQAREGRLIEIDPSGDGQRNILAGAALQFNVVAKSMAFNGLISGAGSFTKDGPETLYLYGNNTYTGGTTVRDGLLVDATPHGDYALTSAFSTLGFITDGTKEFAGRISGSGQLVKAGEGTLTLTGTHSHSGATIVEQGRLIDRNPSGFYKTDAELEFANATDRDFTTPVPVGPATPNSIGGTGNFTKSGAGNLVMYRANSYAGSTTIAEGGIVAGVNDVLPTGTALTVGSAGQFLLPGGLRQTVASLSGAGSVLGYGTLTVGGGDFSGVYLGEGSLVKNGTGTLTLSGVSTYSGGTTVSSGRLIDANPHGAYATNAALEFRTAGAQSYAGAVSGTGSLTKSGAGALTLSGSSTHAGGTFVGAGTLRLRTDAALPTTGKVDVASGATLDLAGYSQSLGALTGAGSVTLGNSGGLRVAGDGSTFAGTISGAGSFAKTGSGTMTLSGVNTYTGDTAVLDAGTLRVTGALSGTGGLFIAENATFDNAATGGLVLGSGITFGTIRTAGSTRFAGSVSGGGNFTGPGTVRFDGGYYPGDSFFGSGLSSIGFGGNLILGSSNGLAMDLNGTTLGTGYDHLTVSQALTFGGNLNVATLNGFAPSLGQSFDLFDFKSSTGSFTSVNLPALSNGLAWDISSLYTSGVIRTQAVPEPATLAALGLGALALLRRRRQAR